MTRFSRKLEGRFEGYSGQRPLERRSGNPEASCDFADRKVPHGGKLLVGNLPLRPSELLALGFRTSQSCDHALLNACPLELRNHGVLPHFGDSDWVGPIRASEPPKKLASIASLWPDEIDQPFNTNLALFCPSKIQRVLSTKICRKIPKFGLSQNRWNDSNAMIVDLLDHCRVQLVLHPSRTTDEGETTIRK